MVPLYWYRGQCGGKRMSQGKISKMAVLLFLLWCVYLISFAEIDFKGIHHEAWYIQIGYFVGFIVVLPAIGICAFLPEGWLVADSSAAVCIAAVGGLMALLIVFYPNVLDWIEQREVKSAK